jgi:glycogen synthase
MLGWEFPPFIAGGLGVACYGLTKALDRAGHQVIFVLPKPVDRTQASHVRMLSPLAMVGLAAGLHPGGPLVGGLPLHDLPVGAFAGVGLPIAGMGSAMMIPIPASFSHPYPSFQHGGGGKRTLLASGLLGVDASEDETSSGGDGAEHATHAELQADVLAALATTTPSTSKAMFAGSSGGAGVGYGNDLVGDAERYARLVVAISRREQFDVIHAHDWLTYPAGLALARVTGKPLIVHVHSTEFDRSGSSVNQRVYDIERAGMHGAQRVIAVSHLTKSICEKRYGVTPEKIDVVHNGLDREVHQPQPGARIESGDKIVLFLGRITMQKGPEYFIAAAKRVLEKVPDAKFVLAGSGDMALRMIELAAGMGIGSKVLFTGFLRGADIERIFSMADCYVMPSVSEPFGIAALEAISHDVPVILSKTSGASEVLTHVLKVDFWDIDEMANKIVAVLRHPPLSQTLRAHGQIELHRLTWDQSAERCVESYERALAGDTSASASA